MMDMMDKNQSVAASVLHDMLGASKSLLATFFGVSRSTVSRRMASFPVPKKPLKKGEPGYLEGNVVTVNESNEEYIAYDSIYKKLTWQSEPYIVSTGSGEAPYLGHTAHTVIDIVADQLGLKNFNVNSTILEMGADSLDTVELVMAIEDEFGIEIPDGVAEQFVDASVAQIIKEVEYKIQTGNFSVNAGVVLSVQTTPVKQVIPQYIITPNCLVIVQDGVPQIIDKSHHNYDNIESALKEQKYELAFDLLNVRETLSKWSNGRVVVDGQEVTLDGNAIAPKLTDRMLKLVFDKDETGLKGLSTFIEKLSENPDSSVVDRLYDFILATDIEIDQDGDVIAFKSVEHNYLDSYTKTIDNSPGKLVSMPRGRVVSDHNQTCAPGLHCMNRKYFGQYSRQGNRIVRVKVHPADFVGIPYDYSDSKARTCRYVVLDDVTEQFYPG